MASLILKGLKDIQHALQCYQDPSATNIYKLLYHTTSTANHPIPSPLPGNASLQVGQESSQAQAGCSGRRGALRWVLPTRTRCACSAPSTRIGFSESTLKPHHLKFYVLGYFTYKPSTLPPAHTSLLGGKSMCMADVSPAAWQLLEAGRKGAGEGSVPSRQWCP